MEPDGSSERGSDPQLNPSQPVSAPQPTVPQYVEPERDSPPLAASSDGGPPPPRELPEVNPPKKKSGLGKLIALVIVALAGYGLFFNDSPPTVDGPTAPNWVHHQEDAAKQIIVADDDLDPATTGFVRKALQENIQVPEIAQLTQGMKQAIVSGDANYYHLFLYDSCAQDGDVVNVLVDGARFAEIPITHQGTTVSVPIRSTGSTTLHIEGVFDGGGGITVACTTSQGEFFIKVMGVGETQQVGLVAK